MVWKRRKIRISNKEFYTIISLYKYEHLSILLSWHLITISMIHARIRVIVIILSIIRPIRPDDTIYEIYL
jgi:hypothetical protein